METAGTTGVVEIQDKHKKRRIQYELGVDIDFAPGKVHSYLCDAFYSVLT